MPFTRFGRTRKQRERIRDALAEWRKHGGGDADEDEVANAIENEETEASLASPPQMPSFPTIIVTLALLKDFIIDPADLTIVGYILLLPIKLLIVVIIFLWCWGKISGTWWKKPLSRWLLRRYVPMICAELLPFVDMVPWTTVFVLMGHYKEKRAVQIANRVLDDIREDFEKGRFEKVDLRMAELAAEGVTASASYAWSRLRPGGGASPERAEAYPETAEDAGDDFSETEPNEQSYTSQPNADEQNTPYTFNQDRGGGAPSPQKAQAEEYVPTQPVFRQQPTGDVLSGARSLDERERLSGTGKAYADDNKPENKKETAERPRAKGPGMAFTMYGRGKKQGELLRQVAGDLKTRLVDGIRPQKNETGTQELAAREEENGIETETREAA
jgi:hypothetical protein